MGINRKIISIAKWMYKLSLLEYKKEYSRKGLELGLDNAGLAEIMSRYAFIDNSELVNDYGLSDDDTKNAIIDSVKQSIKYLRDDSDMISMKYK
ncbi:MAG: hypothetical protein KAU02_00385 [Tenericutes bacterium]|nr:hypothetical protein [Mycoplasmatota bacterium]